MTINRPLIKSECILNLPAKQKPLLVALMENLGSQSKIYKVRWDNLLDRKTVLWWSWTTGYLYKPTNSKHILTVARLNSVLCANIKPLKTPLPLNCQVIVVIVFSQHQHGGAQFKRNHHCTPDKFLMSYLWKSNKENQFNFKTFIQVSALAMGLVQQNFQTDCIHLLPSSVFLFHGETANL